MEGKRQTTPFQIRNPYRLDRPAFDPTEMWEAALAEEEEERQRPVPQQPQHHAPRPLPPHPTGKKQTTPDDSSHHSWNGVLPMTGGIKKLKELQKRDSLKDSEKYQSGQYGKPLSETSTSDNAPSPHSYNDHQSEQQCQPADSQTSHHPYNCFTHSWFGQGFHQRVAAPSSTKQLPSLPPPPPSVPSITVTHYIDSHSELTFERHVEWLTQTALWWDMPVVHLYPAPESLTSSEYVEIAASKFSSWVNFVKIPTGEENRLGPVTLPIKSAELGKVKGPRTIKSSKRDSKGGGQKENKSAETDSIVGGGMVKGYADIDFESRMSMALGSTTRNDDIVDPILGYVFVGSADEQAQYRQVFETMERLYPMIEIRYINSFEPQHQQSRQQQELREDPYLHTLSWIHYWSAAKEAQVLQSKIVNDVVRVRPMWVNQDLLHRNYVPPPPPPISPPSTATDILECPSASLLKPRIPTLPSIYIADATSSSQSLEESLRDIPSATSIATLLDAESTMDEPGSAYYEDRSCYDFDSQDDFTFVLQNPSKRSLLGCTQSTLDIRHDDIPHTYTPSFSRRSKRWGYTLSSKGIINNNGNVSNEGKKRGHRRSASTPLLFSMKANLSKNRECKNLDLLFKSRNQDSDTNMSPPLSSPTSFSGSLTSTSTTSSTASSSSPSLMSALGIGQRLAGLAQRIGMCKVQGSSVMVVDL
ncbi:hypothetical protein BG011_007737 [Mortierella polycephala]|uniref:Uncharacterized protein n=1 Tax=Mortierella polycephala TaxID=41804 RepID=A0A9P6PRY2_9FUNG|nr:hypothetical protein BG011_007737 [Mortierella polycephala]